MASPAYSCSRGGYFCFTSGLNIATSFFGRSPDALNFMAKDMAQEWHLWLKNFEDYVSLASKKFSQEQLQALLLNCGGLELRRLVEGLAVDPHSGAYDGLKAALSEYFCPSKSTVYERYVFRCRKQTPDESISMYVTELRNLSKHCGFGDTSYERIDNQNIRDQFISGLSFMDIRKRLLAEQKLTLKKAVDIAVAMERATEELKEMSSLTINHVSNPVDTLLVTHTSSIDRNGVKCFNCGLFGHFAKSCQKQVYKSKLFCNS